MGEASGMADDEEKVLTPQEEMAQRAREIEATVAAGVIAENKVFRRRNRTLVVLLSMVLVVVTYQAARSIWQTGPILDRLDEQGTDLGEANDTLLRLEKFVEQVAPGLTDGPDPALAQAVADVAAIKAILCAEFPDAVTCPPTG